MTDRWLVFHSTFPVLWIVFAATALAILFVWLEWRKDSRFRLLRVLAQVVAVASVTALVVRPAIRKEFDSNHTILLTPNFDRQIVDSLLTVHPSAQLQRTASAANYRDAQIIGDVDDMNGSTYVIGDGLTVPELDEIPNKKFTYIPSLNQSGIVSVITEQQPRENQIARIHVETGGDQASQVMIKSPGKIEDSVSLLRDQKISTLRIRPKQAGQFIYTIITKDKNGAVIEEQPLALNILPEQKIRILILQEYPTSEVRYLKNFLADRGHAITLRYQLSRNVYRHEFANSEQKKITRIDGETLSNFDLVVVDSDILKKINGNERQQLMTSLRQGMGVLVLFNESPQQTKSADDVLGVSFVPVKSDTAYLSITPGAATMVTTLAASAQADGSIVPMLQTSDKKTLSGYRYHGIGKAGFNLTTETYRFLIEGNESIYASIWSPLLTHLARKKQQPFSVKILTPEPIYANEPVSIEILSASSKPTLLADNVRIPLTEDVLIDDRWIGKAWFDKAGWHTITVPRDSSKVNIYVYHDDELSTVRLSNQKKLNSLRYASEEDKGSNITVGYEPVSQVWFFVMFLIAAGFLWLSPKL